MIGTAFEGGTGRIVIDRPGKANALTEAMLRDLTAAFDTWEREALKLVEKDLILPGYDYCLKCSHTFNLLDARKAISVAERTRYIGRIRNIARQVAQRYVQQREAMGHPLLA